MCSKGNFFLFTKLCKYAYSVVVVKSYRYTQ